jgi:HD superfamily phosphohydrolase
VPDLFLPKNISDSVHKTIKLSQLECDIIQTKIFQRLRNVKQLGLAHYVFPGADFSRFSHSLGVCHITGRILDELNRKQDLKLSHKEIQKYRLAALLHDIGHYPFSHAMEEAIENFFKRQVYEPKDSESVNDNEEVTDKIFFTHEVLGKQILGLDPEIKDLLEKNGFEPRKISSIFLREGENRFQNLISSDLDADRIDYLMRTACHTGLPFGNVDLDYLINQMQVDNNDKLCLSKKALRAADHFLLCRHFDRLQVAYHKTVAALELVLKDVLQALIDAEIIDCSPAKLSHQLNNNDWSHFDDFFILSKIWELKNKTSDNILKLKISSILERNPPRLVGEYEAFDARDNEGLESDIILAKQLEPELSKRFQIDKKRIYLWHQTNRPITGIGSHIPFSRIDVKNPRDQDKYEQAIKIINDNGKDSRPITEVKSSLMSILANKTFNSIRFYILFTKDDIHKRSDIQAYLKENLSIFNRES